MNSGDAIIRRDVNRCFICQDYQCPDLLCRNVAPKFASCALRLRNSIPGIHAAPHAHFRNLKLIPSTVRLCAYSTDPNMFARILPLEDFFSAVTLRYSRLDLGKVIDSHQFMNSEQIEAFGVDQGLEQLSP